jgi:hypothetical protein
MARSKANKQKQQTAKKAAAKLKKSLGLKDCDDLMDAMDQQDAKEADAENSSRRRGRSRAMARQLASPLLLFVCGLAGPWVV